MYNSENIVNFSPSIGTNSIFLTKPNPILQDKFKDTPLLQRNSDDYVVRIKTDSSPYTMRRKPIFHSHLEKEPLTQSLRRPVEKRKDPPSPLLKKFNESQYSSQRQKEDKWVQENRKLQHDLCQCQEELRKAKEEISLLQAENGSSPAPSSESASTVYNDTSLIFQAIRDMDKDVLEKLIVEVYIEIEKREAQSCFL